MNTDEIKHRLLLPIDEGEIRIVEVQWFDIPGYDENRLVPLDFDSHNEAELWMFQFLDGKSPELPANCLSEKEIELWQYRIRDCVKITEKPVDTKLRQFSIQ